MKKETAIRRHKELWGWLAKTGAQYKCDWPKWKANGGKYPEVRNSCFACKMAEQEGTMCEHCSIECEHCSIVCEHCPIVCEHCPIEWPGGECETREGSGLYVEWWHEPSEDRRKELAAEIRDLPWKVADKKDLIILDIRGKMKTNYTVSKIPGFNTIGEKTMYWRISYTEYDTRYTLPEKFFTKKEALLKVKELKHN